MDRRFTRETRLTLVAEPSELAPSVLPEHRVMRLFLRNDGDAPVVFRRGDLRLLDGRGADLRAAISPQRGLLGPGETTAVDLVYRVREGTAPPARLEHAGGAVVLGSPTSARRA